MSLVRVTGTLEFVQQVVEQCRLEYEQVKARSPVGMLDRMLDAFGLEKNPERMSTKRVYTSSSVETGKLVHKELELASAGGTVVNPHPFSVAIADYFRKKQWYVIAAEVPLVVPDLNMYTRIDLLVYDLKNDEPIIAEVKTGYDQGFNARLKSRRSHLGLPPKDIHDSHHSRTHLQLAWMYWAFKNKYAVPNLRPFVVIANSRGVRHEKLASWARINAKLIHERVCKQRATQLAPLSISTDSTHN